MDKKRRIFEAIEASANRLEKEGIERSQAQFVFQGRKRWSLTDYLLHMREEISTSDLIQLKKDEQKLFSHVPPQYILGVAEFFSHELKVTSDTFIPRVETEELVQLVLATCEEDLPLNVVDIGTGSGAIAISLALSRPQWKVWSVDISIGAINVAKENAEKLGANVHFDIGDTLEPFIFPIRDTNDCEYFDVIISNPPYIAKSEQDVMDERVKLFEPELALYAEEEGLSLYKKIARESSLVLKKNGKIFLEIGYKQGEAVKEIFQKMFPKRKVEVKQDMAGLDRMVVVHAASEGDNEDKKNQ